MNSSNATSTSAYPNSKTWGFLNGTACFAGPRPPGRGVDMFRNTWCASVTTELSNAPAAWTCDSRETLSEITAEMPDFAVNHSCIPPRESRREGPEQRAPGLILFCHCPQVAALLKNKSTERRMVGEGIHLMGYTPEF